MNKNIKVKVAFSNRNHPKYYKQIGAKWLGISKQEFDELTFERRKNL